MNDTPAHDPHARNDSKAPKPAHKSNNGAKWAAGALGAAALVGGGLWAVNNYNNTDRPNAEVASTDASYQSGYDSSTGAPFKSNDVAPNGSGSGDVSTASVDSSTTSATPKRKRTTAAQQEYAAVPEQTIGVTPASVTTDYGDEIVVTPGRRPVWASTPNKRRLTALYPQRALDRGREGEARVHCTVLGDGALDCVPVSETPVNNGFGSAAVRVASRFRHAANRADGTTAAGTPVNLRVVFRIEENERRRG